MVDWVTAMDMCAAAGIVNYDAPAAILGQNPRYIGHPGFDNLPSLNGPIPKEFDTYNGNIVRPKSWKKKVFNTLLGIGAALGTVALIQKGKLNVTAIKNFAKGAFNIIKKPFVWIGNHLRPTTPTP